VHTRLVEPASTHTAMLNILLPRTFLQSGQSQMPSLFSPLTWYVSRRLLLPPLRNAAIPFPLSLPSPDLGISHVGSSTATRFPVQLPAVGAAAWIRAPAASCRPWGSGSCVEGASPGELPASGGAEVGSHGKRRRRGRHLSGEQQSPVVVLRFF
jgi:hypothetical protein